MGSPLFRRRLPLLAAGQAITTSKGKFLTEAHQPRCTAGGGGDVFPDFSLGELRGDRDWVSVQVPASVPYPHGAVGMKVYGRARGVHARERVPWDRDNVQGSLWIPRMTS